MIGPFFSLRKSKRIFRNMHRRFNRKAKSMDEYTKESVQAYLLELKTAILKKDSVKAKKMAKELERASYRLMPRTTFDKTKDFIGGLLFALVIAILIRTIWFELYTIPTGSMRPTLKEDDYLVVSKTDYGINVPLQEAHLYFDQDLIQRGSIIVFNGANMDIQDNDTMYFYLFPGKKQFVKRLIGKPGDTIYFYGGDVYGIDAQGNKIAELRNNAWFDKLEHIPFIRFNGKVETPNAPKNGIFDTVLFHQMNKPIAKLGISSFGTISGEMIRERGKTPPKNYFDLLGIKHFAMSRLLTQEELDKIHPDAKAEKGLLYLELTHHPTIKGAQLVRDEYNRLRPDLSTSVSIIPLQENHLEAIANSITTAKFKVKNNVAWRYGWNPKGLGKYLPKLHVSDGTYEIQNGTAYKLPFPSIPILGVFTNGYTSELPGDHPLYSKNPEMVHKLYNLGIEFINQYNPTQKNQRTVPSRYAYFKNGNLYLMGAPVILAEDPTLIDFVKSEMERETLGTSRTPYFPFIDQGAPTKEEILAHGIQIPEKMYLAMGDNHAMSADSREFGFVPEENLKGGVSVLFAPINERMGAPLQPKQPYTTLPNLTVWTAFILCVIGTSLYYRRQLVNYRIRNSR